MTRILSIILALNAIAFGQPAGRKAIDSAADALGGKDRILAIQTLTIEGSGIAPNIGQNPFPEGPLPTWWIPEFKRGIDLVHHRARTQQHRIGMFPFALSTDIRQTQSLDGDVAFNTAPDGRAQRASDTAATDRRIEMLATPVTVVRAALDPGAKLGVPHKKGRQELLGITTAQGDKLTLALDGTTHLPMSVSWMTSSENLGDVVNTTSFEDYETVGGIQLPKRYVTTIDFRGWTSGDFSVSKNIVDGDAGDLAAPAAVKSAAAPGPPPISVDVQQVAKGVWWLSGTGNAFSILFEFDDHLTLFEAPTSEARTKAVIDKARATVPNKPLTEVIVTHHHFDHTGGLRTAVAEGLTVISHQGNEGIFKEMTSRKATVKPDLLTKSGKTLKFRGMGDTLVLKDNSMEVDLFRLHDNTHSPYLIAAYLPGDNLLVQGDLIDMGWTQHPWAENYRQNLAMRKIHFAKDIPVHGRIATFDEEMAALAEMEKHNK
ncbi:MAG: MBL fold metallo-hydrolase [Bryobacteraceae bacterium]|jgi:glyoxylase-like metal-dependent hydrolase (beta-lactamase superfamily II)